MQAKVQDLETRNATSIIPCKRVLWTEIYNVQKKYQLAQEIP